NPQRSSVANRVTDRRPIEDAGSAANHSAARTIHLVRKAESWPYVVPVGRECALRGAVHARKRHDARSAGDWIDRGWIERVHLVVHFAAWQFDFPPHAVVDRQP